MTAGADPDDVEYFRARALQEQIAAATAQSPQARDRHDELAMMYRLKVTMLSTGPEGWAEDTGKSAEADVSVNVSATTHCS